MAEYLVGTVSEFTDEDRKIITIGDHKIVVFKHNEQMHALHSVCPHSGGPVGEGMLIGRVEGVVGPGGEYLGDKFSDDVTHIVCPWHGWEYDICTGKAAGFPKIGLKKYETEVRGQEVYVHV